MPPNRRKVQPLQQLESWDAITIVSEQFVFAQPPEGSLTGQSWLNGPIGIIKGALFGICFWVITLAIAFLFF